MIKFLNVSKRNLSTTNRVLRGNVPRWGHGLDTKATVFYVEHYHRPYGPIFIIGVVSKKGNPPRKISELGVGE